MRWRLVLLTINPGVRDHHGALWQFQLCDLGLDTLVRQHCLLDRDDLLAITWCMDERAQADVAFDLVGRQVDNSLVQFVL